MGQMVTEIQDTVARRPERRLVPRIRMMSPAMHTRRLPRRPRRRAATSGDASP